MIVLPKTGWWYLWVVVCICGVIYMYECVCIPMCIHILSRGGMWSGVYVCVCTHVILVPVMLHTSNHKVQRTTSSPIYFFVQQSLPVQTFYTFAYRAWLRIVTCVARCQKLITADTSVYISPMCSACGSPVWAQIAPWLSLSLTSCAPKEDEEP